MPFATQSQFIPVSSSYKVAAASEPMYTQIPYSSGGIQYGTHLVHPSKIDYQSNH